MVRIGPEEKRREASDWFAGPLGIVIILVVLLAGYLIYYGVRNTLVNRQEARTPSQEVCPTNVQPTPAKTVQTGKPIS